jgi:hypothetical protein
MRFIQSFAICMYVANCGSCAASISKLACCCVGGVCGGADNDFMDGIFGDDDMNGSDGNDNLDSRDGVVDNDSLDGFRGTDTCLSDPDPEVNCELP